jgi:hypothetical protein
VSAYHKSHLFNTPRSASVVADYPFRNDGTVANARDYRGGVGTLSLTASPTLVVGGGITFNGSTQYGEVAASPTMTGTLTVAMRVNITDWSATSVIATLSDGTNTRGLTIGTFSNRLLCNPSGTGSGGAKTSDSHVGAPGWYDLVIVKNTSTNVSVIEVNGVDETGTTGVSYFDVDTSAQTKIGAGALGGSFFAGTISRLIIWERELSAAERAAIQF